jgi:hypothetical protein
MLSIFAAFGAGLYLRRLVSTESKKAHDMKSGRPNLEGCIAAERAGLRATKDN